MSLIIEKKINRFNECLNFSYEAEDQPFWKECYEKFFPTMSGMVSHRKNGPWQKEGIDRSIILECSKQILVDEKARKKNYNDIALEYISNSVTNSPGWVCKPLRADYIAYAVVETGKCYLLPVIQLQSAWKKYGEEWKATYFKVVAQNDGYKTFSTAVPESILYKAIGSFLRCDFTPQNKTLKV